MVSLVNQAKDGNIEDYLGSKQKDLKNFKENLLLFLDSLIFMCQDGPLFDQVFLCADRPAFSSDSHSPDFSL